MNSTTAKIALLSYCRFARQMHYVCTEFKMPGRSLADVIASNGKNLIEYEIKISMSDLKNDKNKPKHLFYGPSPIIWDGSVGTKEKSKIEIEKTLRNDFIINFGTERLTSKRFGTLEESKAWADNQYGTSSEGPNILYYVIPSHLWESSKDKVLESISELYGIITFTDHNPNNLYVQRKARKLHSKDVSGGVLRNIAARMSSEIAALTNLHYNYVKNMSELGRLVQAKFNLNEEVE